MHIAFWMFLELGCRVNLSGQARRRWFGGIVLGAALLMLILGETILNGRLQPRAFVFYWGSCFLLTMLAVVVAFRDIKDVQRKVGREQKDLLEGTLSKIEREARARKRH